MSRTGELDETVASDSDAERSPKTPSIVPALLPTTISRFSISSKLGEGGMGIVMLATDPTLGREVALKVLRENTSGDVDERRARFLREARAMAKLSHENVIVVHEVGTCDGQVFVAMEYVAGTTLTRWQADRPWRQILRVYERAGRGLAAAHAAGLVHRDFKPDNVLIGDDGRIRVTDFGLVAAIDSHDPAQSSTPPDMAASSLTQTGALLGTPRFMAPEQHDGKVVDARADQFAFCVALYAALYHQPPFAGATYKELAASVTKGELAARPPSDVPLAIYAAIARGLSRDREDRFPSLSALLEVLRVEAIPVAAPRSHRRTWIAVVAVALALGLVSGVAYKLRRDAQHATERAHELESTVVQLELKLDSIPPPQPSKDPAERPPTGLELAHAKLEFDSAQTAHQAGRYEQAAAHFLAAYEFNKAPAFLYNAAASHHMRWRQNKDAAQGHAAVELFRRYLAEAPDATDRGLVQRTLDALESALASH